MNRETAEHMSAKARARRMRTRARSLSQKAFSIVMSAILVVGLSPITKASAATAGEQDVSTQGANGLVSGKYGSYTFDTSETKDAFDTAKWSAFRDADNALGDAGSFHVVAFNEATFEADVYGNVLAKKLVKQNGFGVSDHATLSYVQDFQASGSNLNKNMDGVFVFGDSMAFGLCDNGNHLQYTTSNGNTSQIDWPGNIVQDGDTADAPFIDLNRIKNETSNLSTTLASHKDAGATYNFNDMNNKVITYEEGYSGCAYLNIPASKLFENTNKLEIKGLPGGGKGTLVINVDCSNLQKDQWQQFDGELPKDVYVYIDGKKTNPAEEVDSDNRDTGFVLWNFYNAEGKTISAHTMDASVLAPGASLTIGESNPAGTFIADNVTMKNGESHWRPFHGKFDNNDQPSTTSVSVSKQWLDSKGNAEAADVVAAHAGVQVQLLANGEASGDPVTLDASGNWQYTWTDLLAKDSAGNAITYTVQEVSAPKGYTSDVSGSAASGFTITNTHKPVVEVSASKVWNDNGNIDQVRPDSVTANVFRSVAGGTSERVGSLALSASNNWVASMGDLPTADASGNKYTYTVQEDAVPGYTGTTEGTSSTDGRGNVSYAFTLTNSHTPSVVNLSVSKKWVDGNNQDGIRPDSVSVDVLRTNGSGAAQVVATLKLSAENNWTATLDKQPVNGENGAYTYSVSEAKVNGYESSVATTKDDAGNYSFALTNTHATETTEVGVTKVWADENNADGLRPSSVKAQLLANGAKVGEPVELGAGSWSHAWSDLPKKANGADIAYTVEEVDTPAGYTSAVTPTGSTFTITNTHKVEKTSVPVEKVWNDNGNQDGKRAAEVKVQLYRSVDGGQAVPVEGYCLTLNDGNSWKGSFANLPTMVGGKAVTYSVQEVDVPAGYQSAVTGDAATGFTITNTYASEKTAVSVAKAWDDSSNQDGVRPDSVTVRLLANGEEVAGSARTLSDANQWATSWTDLPKYAKGQEIAYTVTEDAVAGYQLASTAGSASAGFILTNKHEVEKTSVNVNKVWSDADNQDGKRPTSVHVQLYADGQPVGQAVELTGETWSHAWNDLPKYAAGKAVDYTVKEVGDLGNYECAITKNATQDGSFSFTLTNTLKGGPEKTSVSVVKNWDDANNQDGVRPASVNVQLFANGQKLGGEVTLSAENQWTHVWEGLDKNVDGQAVTYTVEEIGAVDGYQAEVTGTGNAFTITNKHEVEKTAVGVTKAWSDADNQDGVRPDSVDVQLLANGKVAQTATLSAENGWSTKWENLDKYADGKEIAYTVAEPNVPAGYTAAVTGSAAAGFTITNAHEVEKTSVNAVKAWNDSNNQDGLRPASIEVQLLADGIAEGAPVKLNAANNWSYAWDGLAKFANGKQVAYTVAEVNVPEGYTSAVTGSAAAGFTIANTHTAQTTSIGAKKVWSDGNNQDGLRPAQVTVRLLANGAEVASAQLSEASAWAATWDNLPVFANGSKIAYSVTEDAVEGYITSVAGSAAAGFTITNTHAPAVTQVSVNKAWLDSEGNPQSGVHPAVTAQLYRTVAGETLALPGYTVTLDEGNSWAAAWTNLPAKVNGADATYSVREADVPAGYVPTVADNGGNSFTLVNTAEKRTSVSVTKAWNDSDNADNMRPDSVTARLCTVDAQGNAVAVAGKSVELSAANNWAYTWDDLAVSDADGNELTYTVQEANVPEGYEGSVSGGMVDGAYAFTLTNTHELKTVDINVSKVWNDQNDVDGLRPAQVTAQLCYVNAAGETVPVEGAEEKTLDEGNGWAAAWTGLTANASGKAIKYTVREANVPEGYTSAVSGIDNGDGTYSFTMTNTHEVEIAEFALSGYSVQSISAPVPAPEKVCYVDPKITKAMVGRALEGGEFTFQLMQKVSNGTDVLISTATNDALGTIDFDAANNVAAEGMEPCCLKFTNPGTYMYYVQEKPDTSDPTVEYSNERIEFVVTVAEDGGALKATDMYYVYYKDKSDTVGTKIDATDDEPSVHPTITNHVKPIQLGLTKVDAATQTALAGATYGLYRAGEDNTQVLVAKAVSDATGHMTFMTASGNAEAISEGVDYWFEEISAPEGYALSDEPTQHFRIAHVGVGSDSKYQLVYDDKSKSQLYDAGTTIEFGDGKTPVTDKTFKPTVTKVNSARSGLAGAKLGVRQADATTPIEEWESSGAGHVLNGLKANTQYVLYEAEAPDGFEKAADVTFTLDERGNISLADGAWNGNTLNAYATDSQLSLVDYTNKEIVESKQVQREQGKPAAGKTGKLTQTGDQSPVLPLALAAVAALAVAVAAGAAAAKRRKR